MCYFCSEHAFVPVYAVFLCHHRLFTIVVIIVITIPIIIIINIIIIVVITVEFRTNVIPLKLQGGPKT